MFAFCAYLVALGHFREVQLSFLIVGHTYDDIDQRFNVISNILKRQDILSLKQMLAQVKIGARGRDVAFTSIELLENIWNWSGFIADHLHIGNNAWTGTRNPHHFRFYVQNNEPRVQYKTYCTDVWAPEGRYSAMTSVPATRAKLRLSAVLPADSREVQALEEFIALKERQINRLVRVDENLDAILETEWLKDYILTFPNRDRSGATMPRLHGRETGRTRRTDETDGRDRLKCPRDKSFETVPRIFNFLLKRSPKNMTGKEEEKKQVRESRT